MPATPVFSRFPEAVGDDDNNNYYVFGTLSEISIARVTDGGYEPERITFFSVAPL